MSSSRERGEESPPLWERRVRPATLDDPSRPQVAQPPPPELPLASPVLIRPVAITTWHPTEGNRHTGFYRAEVAAGSTTFTAVFFVRGDRLEFHGWSHDLREADWLPVLPVFQTPATIFRVSPREPSSSEQAGPVTEEPSEEPSPEAEAPATLPAFGGEDIFGVIHTRI